MAIIRATADGVLQKDDAIAKIDSPQGCCKNAQVRLTTRDRDSLNLSPANTRWSSPVVHGG